MKLLLAEDEVELSNALCAILKHAGYSVDAVYNGKDAYEYARVGSYDGLILDIMMPGMDGMDVLKTLRMEGKTMPALFLTARQEVSDRVRGLDLGADDYLTKPFDKNPRDAAAQGRVPTRGAYLRQCDSGPLSLRTADKRT